jgi:hypothetical protein
MIPLQWFAFLDVPITIWLRPESALFDISRPRSPNQRLSLRRAGGFRVRSPSIRARIDRGASAIYDEAVRAHRAGLALPCVFVESVGYSISRNPLFGAIGQWRGSASQHSIRRFPRFLASRACPHRAETPSLGTRSAVVAGASAPLHEFDRPLLVLGLLEVESRQRGCVDLIDGVLDGFRLALEHFCRHQRRRAQAAHVPR